jgi:hypothetical protein
MPVLRWPTFQVHWTNELKEQGVIGDVIWEVLTARQYGLAHDFF